MEIGIGLPATIPGVTGAALVEWARRSEARGFSTLATLDRLVYANYEPLVALTAAAAVTERIRLTTAILIAPLRLNTALLAKQTATTDNLSGGRLVLGLAPGGREDDFQAGGADFHRRGRMLDQQLDELRRIWNGERRGFAGAIGPAPTQAGGPPLILGGSAPATFRRAARYGEGWIAGGGGPDLFRQGAEALAAAWAEAGRAGQPRKLALTYFALGPDARRHAESYLRDYYAFLDQWVDAIIAGAAVTEDMVRQQVAAFAEAGCDELILFPCSTDPAQVDLLADAVQ